MPAAAAALAWPRRPERDPAGALELARELPGDEEARDHEEDVDADIAAREPPGQKW